MTKWTMKTWFVTCGGCGRCVKPLRRSSLFADISSFLFPKMTLSLSNRFGSDWRVANRLIPQHFLLPLSLTLDLKILKPEADL